MCLFQIMFYVDLESVNHNMHLKDLTDWNTMRAEHVAQTLENFYNKLGFIYF